jgi:menaquinol-cytochrome c reductase iron-sulfur subunit
MSHDASAESRRTFMTSAAAVAAGGVVAATPVVVGVATFLSPLGKTSETAKVRVALLEQVPDDGQPRFFPVVADRVDAWTRYAAQRIGAVYLVREKGAATPIAFTAKCPHAGCFIGYMPGDDLFKCPCHTSSFQLDGSRARGDKEVSPRDMDRLTVEIRKAKSEAGTEVDEVWIEFADFQTGRKEQVRSA